MSKSTDRLAPARHQTVPPINRLGILRLRPEERVESRLGLWKSEEVLALAFEDEDALAAGCQLGVRENRDL